LYHRKELRSDLGWRFSEIKIQKKELENAVEEWQREFNCGQQELRQLLDQLQELKQKRDLACY